MITSAMNLEFESLLKKRQLAKPAAIFADPDFFDEIPLYVRYSEVEFLKRYGDINLLLIQLAIAYLQRVVSETQHIGNNQFAAITVISDDDESIVPSIFVCNRKVKTRLKALHLSPPSKGLGKRVKTLVKKAKLHPLFSVLEDRSTVPEDVRVFILFRSPPQGFTNPEALASRAAHSQG